MHRFLLPFSLAALSIPVTAQVPPRPVGLTEEPSVFVASKSMVPEPIGTLGLQAALQLAMQANPELLAAQHELQALEGTVLQAGVLPNPSMEFLMEDKRKETRETTVQLSQPIELGGKRAARVHAAEQGRAAASADLDARQADIRAAVINAFFDVLTAQERLRLSQQAVELAQHAASIAGKRVTAGKVSPVEKTKADVAESSVRLELMQAQAELSSARKRLAATWGSTSPRFIEVTGQAEVLPALPEQAALAVYTDKSPLLARARSELGHRQALSAVERSKRIPDVTLSLGVKRSEELGRNQAIVGVSIPLPLFDTNRGNIVESLRREDKARAELKIAEVKLDNDLVQAFDKLSSTRQEADVLQKDVVPGAQSAYDAAVRGFEYGKFGFLDVLDAQRTLLQVKAQYLRTLSEAHRAAAAIERLLGTTLNTNN